jgi:hypothetical protein
MNNVQNLRYVFLLLPLVLSMPLQAEEQANTVANEQSGIAQPEIGDSTKAWLEMQSSGSQASAHKQTLSGPVMDNIYGRYRESFNRPIPQSTEQNARSTK